MKPILRRVFGHRWWSLGLFVIAGTGFVASLAVHLASYFSLRVLAERDIVYWLHGICLALCFLAVPFGKRLEKLWGRPAMSFTAGSGPIAERVVAALFTYALINFILFLAICWWKGELRVWKEEDAFYASGRLGEKRELTQEQYLQHKLRELRGFSGHWMLFYTWPTLFFLRLKPGDLFAPEPQPAKERVT